MNLFTKLKALFNGKKIAALLVAALIALAPLGVAACSLDIGTAGSGTDADGTGNGNTDDNGNTGNGNTDDNGNTDNGNTDGGGNTDNETQYTDILNTILESDYYTSLVSTLMVGGTGYFSFSKHFQHPYGFLESEGYDVDAIKNGPLDCESTAYFIEDDTNHIYISTKVEDTYGSGNSCYTNYVLKYYLTDQEYNEVYILYENSAAYAPLWIQELSYQKTPEIVSEAKIDVNTYNNLSTIISSSTVVQNIFDNGIDIDFTAFSTAKNEIYCNLRTRVSGNSSTIISDCEQRNLTVSPAISNVRTIDGVYVGPSTALDITNEDLEEFQNNYDAITYLDVTGKKINKSFNLSTITSNTSNTLKA